MLLCFTLMIRTTCCYAHEPNLNVDQVPPNRALFVQPQLPYGKALMRYAGGLLLRVFTKEGRLRAAVAFGRVNGGSLDSQYVLGAVPVWYKFCAMRWFEPCSGSVGMTPGYPGQVCR